MRYPSIKTLTAAFGAEKAKLIRAIIEGPKRDAAGNRRLERIDEVLGNYGVEYIPRGHNTKSPALCYSNTGDPYTTTVMRVGPRHTWRVGCWGDIAERGNYD